MENNFKEKFESFLEGCRNCIDTYMQANFPNNPKEYLNYAEGPKFIKIIKACNEKELSGSAWAFIDKQTGDVLKPASWKTPAKHARGNIFDEFNGLKYVGPYGPAYLK